VLIAEDLEPWAAEDLLTVIQRLRPRWLTSPLAVGMSGPAPRSVVVDDVRQPGSLELLRGYVAGHVAEARFMNARDATTRYGINMMSGAIVVRLKR